MPTDLAKITELMGMQVAASQSRLRQIRLREARLLTLLSELDAHTSTPTHQNNEVQIGDFLNDIRLRRWVDQRRASVNTELAQTRTLIAMAQADLTRHFARQQAADALVEAKKHEQRIAAKRKAYWAS